MHYALALAIAVNFWSARGVEVPCQPVATPGAQLAIDPTMPPRWRMQIPMAADVATCRILISADGAQLRKDGPELYCADVVHEVGHLAGLEHSETGIMAEAIYPADVPWYCDYYRVYAKKHGIPLSGPRRGSASGRAL